MTSRSVCLSAQLQLSRLGTNVTNPGNLNAHVPIFNNPFAMSLRNYKVLQEEDVLATAKIMQRCLRLNPKDRAGAEELLQDPWWHDAA